MGDGLPRIPMAKEGEAARGETLCPRIAHFFFRYNWDTREKEVFLSGAGDEDGEHAPWEKIYSVSVELPVPVDDEAEVISITEIASEARVPFKPDQPIAYQVARRIFFRVRDFVPEGPIHLQWQGVPHDIDPNQDPSKSSMVAYVHGKRLKITVEETDV